VSSRSSKKGREGLGESAVGRVKTLSVASRGLD